MPKLKYQVQLLPYLTSNLNVQIDIVYLNILVRIYHHLCFLDNFIQSYDLLRILTQYAQIKKPSPITTILGKQPTCTN